MVAAAGPGDRYNYVHLGELYSRSFATLDGDTFVVVDGLVWGSVDSVGWRAPLGCADSCHVAWDASMTILHVLVARSC